jgi:hypothetical protein
MHEPARWRALALSPYHPLKALLAITCRMELNDLGNDG